MNETLTWVNGYDHDIVIGKLGKTVKAGAEFEAPANLTFAGKIVLKNANPVAPSSGEKE